MQNVGPEFGGISEEVLEKLLQSLLLFVIHLCNVRWWWDLSATRSSTENIFFLSKKHKYEKDLNIVPDKMLK